MQDLRLLFVFKINDTIPFILIREIISRLQNAVNTSFENVCQLLR